MHLQVFFGTLRHRIQPVELHAVRNHVFGVKANQHFKCCGPEWQVEEFDFPLPSVKMLESLFEMVFYIMRHVVRFIAD